MIILVFSHFYFIFQGLLNTFLGFDAMKSLVFSYFNYSFGIKVAIVYHLASIDFSGGL